MLYPDQWGISADPNKIKYNNSISFGFDNYYRNIIGTGSNLIKLRTSAFYSSYNFSTISYTNINKKTINKLTLKTRVFAQYAFGTEIADESSLYLAGANPEELVNNKFTRAVGYVDNTWLGYGVDVNHFQEGGGLNLRGYAGYLVPDNVNNEYIYVYKGSSGAAFNAELEFNKLIYHKPNKLSEFLELNSYLFGDAGIINSNFIYDNLTFAQLRADAGLGVALTIKKWGPLSKLKPLTFRFDMPLFLNRPPYEENKYIKFRWVVGVNMAF